MNSKPCFVNVPVLSKHATRTFTNVRLHSVTRLGLKVRVKLRLRFKDRVKFYCQEEKNVRTFPAIRMRSGMEQITLKKKDLA